MPSKKSESVTKSMAEDKQVAKTRLFTFPDGTRIEATTAMEAARIKKASDKSLKK